MSHPPIPQDPRVTAARERAVRLLSLHFAEDRLSVDELDARMEKAYRSRSLPEIDALLADLPSEVVAPAAAPVVRGGWWRRFTSGIIAILGGAVRRGRWQVPSQLNVVAIMGGVELDLSEAELSGPLTEIRVFAVMGGVEIRVPPTMRIESHGIGIMGGFEDRVPEAPADPNAPVVRITGVAIMAGVETSGPRKDKREKTLPPETT